MTLTRALPLLFAALMLCLPAALRPAGAAPPPAGLSVLPTPAAARAEIGAISVRRPVRHTFVLQNSGAVPLTVYNLHSSCGCTSAVAGARPLPVVVPPGRRVSVEVSLDTSDLSPGYADKTVWVEAYAPSGPVPSTALEIVGTVGPASAASPAVALPPSGTLGAAPDTGQAAPAFTLADTDGRPRSSAALRGAPAAVFFFCGCPWCADCARAWAKAARAGRIAPQAATWVVFSGDTAAARRFRRAAGLDPRRVVFLPDPTLAVTERRFRLNTCPRVFVLDPSGTIRYTNSHPGDTARIAPASVIVARASAALSR